MPYPTWSAGQRITAGLLQAGSNWTMVSQLTNQTVTNSTTLASSDLIVPVEANAVYMFMLRAAQRAPQAQDIKFAWSIPSGTTMNRVCTGPGVSDTGAPTDLNFTSFQVAAAATTEITVGGVGAGTSVAYTEDGSITASSTAGDVTLQFAQNVAGAATDAELRSFSRLYYVRIG